MIFSAYISYVITIYVYFCDIFYFTSIGTLHNNKKTGGDTMELQKVQRTTLTMKEAAEYLGISYWLVNRLVRRKQIP